MIREDYVIRLIKQIVQMLAAMMRLRKAGSHEAALRVADQLYDALGIPRELCDVVDTPTLASMLVHPDKMRAAAKLFWEEGDLFKAKRDPLTAFARYRRALEMFLEVRAISPDKEEDDSAILELGRMVPVTHLDERYREQ